MTSLVDFSEKHLVKTYDWICDTGLKKNFLLRRQITFDEHLAWYESYKSDESQRIFAICQGDIHCGNCGLKFISHIDRKAELWIYLGNIEFEGKGVAINALNLLLDFGYNRLDLNKIYLHVASSNERALKLYDKLGFIKEGEFEQEMIIENQYITIKRLCRFRNQKL